MMITNEKSVKIKSLAGFLLYENFVNFRVFIVKVIRLKIFRLVWSN